MPASYPGAVKTFTTRSAGQTIEPSHVNDLQDEVNAIEAGLLNGTAPLNSSNSTVAALVVSSGLVVSGIARTGSATSSGASAGQLVLQNSAALAWAVATNTSALGVLVLSNANQVSLNVNSTSLNINNPVTSTTVGAAGGGAALPATPSGYITLAINGSDVKVPFYAV